MVFGADALSMVIASRVERIAKGWVGSAEEDASLLLLIRMNESESKSPST